MSEKQLAVKIEEISEANAPALYVTGGLQQFIDLVKGEVGGEVPDLKTRKGRERIASLAAKVSKSKTAVEKPGRDYLRRLKEMPKVVEAELREFVTEMDKLRDETRRPLTEWEEAEKARVARHEQGVAAIKAEGVELGLLATDDLLARIGRVEAVALGDTWEEFAAEAGQVKDQVLAALREALVARQKYDAEQAELARLRREADERAEQDRIRAAQEAAVEAERQRIAQQQQAERDAAARREQELIDQAAAQQRAIEQAEANRIAAEQRADQERQDAARRAEEAAEQARQEERRRADAAAAEILRQQEARERDQTHKAKVMGEAKAALMSMNITEELARAIVLKIARREVPNITINF